MACSNRNSIFQEDASGGGWVFDSVKERKHMFYCKKSQPRSEVPCHGKGCRDEDNHCRLALSTTQKNIL